MPRITFAAKATAYQGNPHDYNEVTDAVTLQTLHGVHSDDSLCTEHLDEQLVSQLGLTGGRLRFVWNEEAGALQITTTYGIATKPDKEQLRLLKEETEAQWSDGIGSGNFAGFNGDAMSSALGMAILNQHPDALESLPDLFVDAWPFGEDRGTRVSWSDKGGPDDFLIHDLKTAAKQGHATAQSILGEMYLGGEIVKQDPALGIGLLKQSASQNDPNGLVMLALACIEGDGIEKNIDTAVSLLERGVEAGSHFAMAKLGEMYKEGEGVPQQPEKALPLIQRAADEGFVPALAVLGDCYEYGHGVKIDLKTALQFYESALELGFDPVAPAIERVKKQMKGGILGMFKRK